MKKLLIPGLMLAAAATLAACGGGGGGGGATAATSSGGGAISVMNIGGAGMVLVDSSGKALYASDQESAAGKVLCTGACNSFWTPVTANGGSPDAGSVPGKVGTIKRPDGGLQVTYNGKPLYTFTKDQAGQVTGDGFQDAFGGQQFTWHVVSVGNGGSGSAGSTKSGGGGGYSY
jgi:predicted lipoprotein with Yx(FWY)xxD motif